MSNKIVIAGGSGALGNALIKKVRAKGFDIVVLTRNPHKVNDNGIRYVQWDAKNIGDWVKELEHTTAVINVVGKPVSCRHTQKNKNEIMSSRVDATAVIGKAIQQTDYPPKVWVNAGSAAIFGNSGDEIKDETSEVAEGFLPEVCKQWEKAFDEAKTPETRKVLLRIGLVFQANEGLLKPFANIVKWGLGGTIGTGEQYVSWIHEQDFVNVVLWAIQTEDVQGIVHCASPNPITNKRFMKALRTSLHVPFGLPNITPFIKLGCIFIGTEPELVLAGRRVVSKVLQEKKFEFKHPVIEEALTDLLL